MASDVSLRTFSTKSYGSRRFAILLTCYMTGSTEGHNLGTAGYSYDFVAQLFSPLLSRWGELIPVPEPEQNLHAAADSARRRGLEPVHVSFLPFQDVYLAENAPNVVVPAWEYPDIPNEAFGDDLRNDWVAMANRCNLVIVGGPFTVRALRRGGVTAPIRIVPVPTADPYFGVTPWDPSVTAAVDCRAYEFPQPVIASSLGASAQSQTHSLKQAGKGLERAVRYSFQSLIGPGLYDTFRKARRKAGRKARQRIGSRISYKKKARPIVLPYHNTSQLDLSGIVYTSIFNPDDGRKNWHDLITGFLLALGDRPDATLVVKLITKNAESVARLIRYYRSRDVKHRCRFVFISDFLSDDQMVQLARASTYYVQTTKAEGNCLPLMNYLAAGRPGISPDHSAMGDYFDTDVGFVVDSHPEPAAFPHVPRLGLRTSWGRLVWPSLKDKLQASYRLAKENPSGYARLADRCRLRLQNWASYDAVGQRLNDALSDLAENRLGLKSDETSAVQWHPWRKAA